MRTTELVAGFRQSAPYLNHHRGRTFVLMIGGEVIQRAGYKAILNDIALLHSLGIKIVLVYGARPQINHVLEQANIKSEFFSGIRITEEPALEYVKQAAGALMLDITARLSMSISHVPNSTRHLNVISGNFVIAQPLGVEQGVDFCHSGKVRRIDVSGIKSQLDNHGLVVLGPVAASVTGESFNLTAEEVATQVAVKIGAEKMIGFCPDHGIKDEQGEIIPELKPEQAQKIYQSYQGNSQVCHSTKAFLAASIEASRNGVARCHLVSDELDGALLQELFSRDGIGTQFDTQSSERMRKASIADINGILDLIRPLEKKGYLVRRSREQLEMEIDRFSIIEIDSLVIGCAALYPFAGGQSAEFACLAVHPEYRDQDRGSLLLRAVIQQAKLAKMSTLFALTTHSIHWFLEQGFVLGNVTDLPEEKRSIYNLQRGSKILIYNLEN